MKKESKGVLEARCWQVGLFDKQKYTFIKTSISVVANDLGQAGYTNEDSSGQLGLFPSSYYQGEKNVNFGLYFYGNILI